MKNIGKCYICSKEYSKAGMGKHLENCRKKSEIERSKKMTKYFRLKIESYYSKNYFLFIDVKETATLNEIDNFLRDIWLECCGHLSSFTIDGVDYSFSDESDFISGIPSKSINTKLKNVLEKGLKFTYYYDFGSTTKLKILVTGYYEFEKEKEKIKLLARNKPKEIVCTECTKNKAKYVDIESFYEYGEDRYFCDSCIDAIEDDEIIFMPLTNSPRCGVCGYEGSVKYPEY